MSIDPSSSLPASRPKPSVHRATRFNCDPERQIRYRVAVGRKHERVGEFASRDDAVALIRELAATYGRSALATLVLEFSAGHRPPVVLGRGAEFLDVAPASHRPTDAGGGAGSGAKVATS